MSNKIVKRQHGTKNAESNESIVVAKPHSQSITNFKEAVGKTVKSIKHNRDIEEGVWTFELWFTDGTLFLFDIDARPRVRANFMKKEGGDGDLESIRQYGRKTVCDW